MASPLEGVRVVDLTQYESGASATQFLAWLGADVIKVEPPHGEPGRRLFGSDPEKDSFFFLLFNQSKRSITLDLGKDEDRTRLDELLRAGDVMAANFSPGTLERLGLGADRLQRDFPQLVIATVRGYASGGPWSEFKSLDMVAQAVGGAMSVTGEADGRPVRMGPTAADASAGLHLAIGILAALHRRSRTGRGSVVEVSLQDAVVQLMRTALVSTYVSQDPAPRQGADVPAAVPSGLHPCHPGGPNDYVFILLTSNRHWEGIPRAIGREELLDDPRYARQSQRNARAEEVNAMVRDWTRQRTKFEAMERLSEFGVPCGAVLDTRELLANDQLRAAGMLVEQHHPQWGSVWLPGCPIRIEGFEPRVDPSPGLGEHTAEVLRELATPPSR